MDRMTRGQKFVYPPLKKAKFSSISAINTFLMPTWAKAKADEMSVVVDDLGKRCVCLMIFTALLLCTLSIEVKVSNYSLHDEDSKKAKTKQEQEQDEEISLEDLIERLPFPFFFSISSLFSSYFKIKTSSQVNELLYQVPQLE